jgi:4-amino-4-deoxy-L-arabinose transferase-like glycosyltransferase
MPQGQEDFCAGTAVSSRAAPSDPVRAVVTVILVGSLLRLAVGAMLGLSVDESYTTAIARQLSLSYFDHPPLHVWLVGGWAKFVGNEAPWLVRTPFVLLFAGSSWLLFRLSGAAFGDRPAFWTVLAFNLAPLFAVGFASWVLPDGPLMFCSLVMIWSVNRALLTTASEQGALRWWLMAGVSAGLALLSKYLAVFPALGVALFLLTSRHRRVLATPGPWIALVVAIVLFTPVIMWNAQHGWVSIAFQGARAIPTSFSAERFSLDLAGQFAYLSPVIAVGLVFALGGVVRRGPRDEAGWLFGCLAVGPIAFFSLAALWTTVLPHWSAIGWLFAFPLLGRTIGELEQARPRLFAVSIHMTAGFLALILALGVSQATTGWLDRFVRTFPANDPMVDVLDWRELKGALASRRLLQSGLVLATVSYIDAGKVDYALGGTVPVLCLTAAAHHYAFLHNVDTFRGRDVIIVANGRRSDWRQLVEPYFQRVEPLPDLSLTRASEPVLTLKIARGIALRSPMEPK